MLLARSSHDYGLFFKCYGSVLLRVLKGALSIVDFSLAFSLVCSAHSLLYKVLGLPDSLVQRFKPEPINF